MAIITINGRAFPGPDKGGKLTVATNVSQGKNALGEFVGQKVGRDISLTVSSGNCWMRRPGRIC